MKPIHLLPMSKNVADERGHVEAMFHLSEDQALRSIPQMLYSEKVEATENEQEEEKEQEYRSRKSGIGSMAARGRKRYGERLEAK